MFPLHAKCRKCGKFSAQVPMALGEHPQLPEGWRLVAVSTDQHNKYVEVLFCPDCVPALLKEIPS